MLHTEIKTQANEHRFRETDTHIDTDIDTDIQTSRHPQAHRHMQAHTRDKHMLVSLPPPPIQLFLLEGGKRVPNSKTIAVRSGSMHTPITF
jgi:hypothetical protein